MRLKKERLNYPRKLEIFKEFLRKRREVISEDFKILSEKYKIRIEILEEIKEEIRKILGENTEYLSTTIHLRPRAIDYLKLGYDRISQAIDNKSKIFHYPVYYQNFEDERPDFIYFGNYHFSLCEIIPNLRGKKIKTSLDFYLSLREFLSKGNWEEEITNNLKEFLNKKFEDFKSKLREEFIQHIINVVVSILRDYQEFFNQEDLKSSLENIISINQQLAQVILNNFSHLEPILKKINIEKEYLEDIANGTIERISSEFIFLICILGNLIHIGAEYGKLNNFRFLLGLNKLPESEAPQERFRFFEVRSSEKAESDSLRFLLEEPDPFIYTAAYSGLEKAPFSPIFEINRKRIRIIDFYLKIKNFFDKVKNGYLREISLSSKNFLNLIEKIDYFDFLNYEEREILRKILAGIKKEKMNKNLEEWIAYYNNDLIKNIEISQEANINKKRFLIHLNVLIKKLLWWIFKNYLRGNFPELKTNLPKEISSLFFESLLELKISGRELSVFYGITLPISISNIDRADLVFLSCFFSLATNDDFNLFSDCLSKLF